MARSRRRPPQGPGAHSAIIDPELFDRVQAMLATHRRERKERPVRAASMPLRGLVFDTDGDPMSPSFTYGRNGKVYRYYLSAPMQQGRPVRSDPDALRRVTADEIEGVLERELRRRLARPDDAALRDMIGCVMRVDLEAQAVRISVLRAQVSRHAVVDAEPDPLDPNVVIVTLPIRCKFRSGRTWITGANDRAARVRREPVWHRRLIPVWAAIFFPDLKVRAPCPGGAKFPVLKSSAPAPVRS